MAASQWALSFSALGMAVHRICIVLHLALCLFSSPDFGRREKIPVTIVVRKT
jgi:hypothetical protein